MEGAEPVLVAHLVAAAEVGSVLVSVEAVASAEEASQEATRRIFTLVVPAPGYTDLEKAARADVVYWARQKMFGAQAKVNDQNLAHEVVMEVQAANGAMVDGVAHAALVATAELEAVVESVEGAKAGLVAHLVAAAEVGSLADLVEAAEVVEALASAAEARQEATCHILILALETPGCTELVKASRAAPHYWAREKDLGALDKVDDQYLAHEVVTIVQAANGAMVVLGAVCLAAAGLDMAVASANSVDKAILEVAAPAADWKAYLVVPGGLEEKVKHRAAVRCMVVAMEALVLAHLLAARMVSPT